MNERSVIVQVFSSMPAQDYLEFRLIFDDHYEKYYKLDQYAIKAYRGASEREIIEHCALDYYDMICEPVEHLRLIFM